MEIFTIDKSFNRTLIIDAYESFIWTERYDDVGDFKIRTYASPMMREYLRVGRWLSNNESNSVMIIEKIEIKDDEEGIPYLTAEGRSLEALLDYRIVTAPSLSSGPAYRSSGTLGYVIELMVRKICVTGTSITDRDVIPGLESVDRTNTTALTSVSLQPQSLLTAVKDLCTSDGLGFRLQPKGSGMEFAVYEGKERPEVYFSSTLDNLSSETHAFSNKNYYNVAYVWAKDGKRMVQVSSPEASTTTTLGLSRRVLYVAAEDIDFSDTKQTEDDLLKQMKRRGQIELAKHRKEHFLDGIISPNSNYQYRKDFFIGDVVRVFNENYSVDKAIVTEYIWAHDGEGQRSYPSFREYGD